MVFWAVLLPVQAWSHPGHDMTTLFGSGLSVGSGTMIEVGHDEPVQILVAVSYSGWGTPTADHLVFYRYFWVSAQSSFTGGPSAELASIGLNIVPVSRVTASHEGVITSLRYFPIEIRRDVVSGIDSSLSVLAIGWARRSEGALGGGHGSHGHDDGDHVHETPHFTKFAQIAVDVIGLRVADFADEGLFLGGQVGAVQVQAGLGWNINENHSLTVSLGGRGSLAAGTDVSDPRFKLFGEGDAFAQIQYLLDLTWAQLSFQAEGGFHMMGTWHPDYAQVGGAPEGHERAHGHPYVAIGAGASF